MKIGIIGGAGYTGGEAIRILLNHPDAELSYVHSNSNADNKLSDVHSDLLGETDMRFTGELSWEVDALMLCVGHGDARKFLTDNAVPEHVRIVDLSQDFRLAAGSVIGGRQFVYGLPEMNLDRIAAARNIANPGCFATCLQLALLPPADARMLCGEINITATTGSTGAGQKPGSTTHFSWRSGNLSVYKPFEHQHLNEIGESLNSLQPGFDVARISFIPYRGDFPRGIIASTVVDCTLSQDEAVALYKNFYRDAAFTFVCDRNIDLKQVVNTNKCFIHLEKHGNKLLIISIIDNLLKGACGQAVQNLNIMFGLPQTTGLKLKSIAF
ncbi:MAG: N-acetyl-gamma-glutamyl-phosphate reductase [Rikenellaceae bacterium]|jgi:N-acetyl-gamma-glutamyl-phosphate reductase|nr:N-acetyl-gamma-glutamyl-phosphate reductase [Rikenellaceae bacterium]